MAEPGRSALIATTAPGFPNSLLNLLPEVPISTLSPKKFTFISCKAGVGMVESTLQGLLDVTRCGRSGSR